MGVLMELRAAANFWVQLPLLGGWQGPLLAPGTDPNSWVHGLG